VGKGGILRKGDMTYTTNDSYNTDLQHHTTLAIPYSQLFLYSFVLITFWSLLCFLFSIFGVGI